MPTLASIYNVRGNLLAGISLLLADQFRVVALDGEADPMEPPYVGYEYRDGGDNLHRYPVPSGSLAGQKLRDIFEGEMILTLTTRRDEDDHDALLGDLLAAIPDTGNVLSGYLATWYGLGTWQISGIDTTTDSERRMDETRVTVRTVLGVLPASWPT